MEVALKLAYVHAQRSGHSKKPKFLSLQGAYHGDTAGAVSLGHIDLFHKAYAGLLFKTDRVMTPYCYRCPFNRAKPERADARDYRKCNHECLDLVEKKFVAQKRRGNPYAAFVFEPLMQGAAGMIPQPRGWLRQVAEIARAHGAQLIADEVMTGFGRTGFPDRATRTTESASLFASHHEGVQPDFLALAKGLTGGYLPMAATLTTQTVFDAFLGDYAEFKTFFHGHSFTGNQLGAAAALASLDLLQSHASIRARQTLAANFANGTRFAVVAAERRRHPAGRAGGGHRVGEKLAHPPAIRFARTGGHPRLRGSIARRGVLTRPIGNVLVLMLPYCTTSLPRRKLWSALHRRIHRRNFFPPVSHGFSKR